MCLFIQQLLTECTFCVIVGGAMGYMFMRDGSQSSGSRQPVSREYSLVCPVNHTRGVPNEARKERDSGMFEKASQGR